jgi:hypothetical protein
VITAISRQCILSPQCISSQILLGMKTQSAHNDVQQQETFSRSSSPLKISVIA